MRTPRRHSPSRRRRWSVSGSLIPVSSSSFPAGPAPSARHAPLAHTCSAHRSSCGDKDRVGASPLGTFLKTDLHHESKLLKCQIFQYISAVGSPGALGTKVTFEPQSRLPVSSAKAEIPKIYYNMIIIARFN